MSAAATVCGALQPANLADHPADPFYCERAPGHEGSHAAQSPHDNRRVEWNAYPSHCTEHAYFERSCVECVTAYMHGGQANISAADRTICPHGVPFVDGATHIDCPETAAYYRTAPAALPIAPGAPKLSADTARAARAFIDAWADRNEYIGFGNAAEYHKACDQVDPAVSALMELCPHPGYVHGGSCGEVCEVCGAMRGMETEHVNPSQAVAK